MVKIMKTWTCDGTGSNYYDGHPMVTLYENQKCPYCGREYVDTSNIREESNVTLSILETNEEKRQ